MSQPTERPWRQQKYSRLDKRIAIVAKGMEHAPLAWVDNDDTQDGPANARLIIRAVNSHDALLAAAEAALKVLEVASIAGESLYAAEVTQKVREAIAAAKGTT
jgi:fructoselysine-6-P-deglycase FrlB-like protein